MSSGLSPLDSPANGGGELGTGTNKGSNSVTGTGTGTSGGGGAFAKVFSKTTEVLKEAKKQVVAATVETAQALKTSGDGKSPHSSQDSTNTGNNESQLDTATLLLGMDLEDIAPPEELKTMFQNGEIVMRKVQLYEIVRPAIDIMRERAKLAAAAASKEQTKKEHILKYLLVGTDKSSSFCKILRVYRVGRKLRFEEDEQVLSNLDVRKFLSKLDKELATKNCSLKLLCRGEGFVGVLKLIYGNCFVIVEKIERVAVITGREIFAIKKLAYFPAYDDPPQPAVEQPELNVDLQYIQMLERNLDVDRQMYCSYNYDLTSSYQNNYNCPATKSDESPYSFMYTFNFYLANRFLSFASPSHRSSLSKWVVPVIQGFVGQRKVLSFAADKTSKKDLTLTLIARRSRHFTGTRYNRRGMMASDGAYVANEVESEIIVSSGYPWISGPDKSRVVSFQLIRGSIPLFWTQINPLSPHPEIQIYKKEDDYRTTKKHFERLIKTYKGGVVVLNLIKQVDKTKKKDDPGAYAANTIGSIKLAIPTLGETGEPNIGNELQAAVDYLKANRFNKSIDYQAYDFHFQKKARANYLGEIVECIKKQCSKIGVFSVDAEHPESDSIQHGVVRVNCIDCLDRTNVGQYCVVRAVLQRILEEFDLKSSDEEMLSSADVDDLDELQPELVNSIKTLFKKHGDAISMQYAGSEAMHSDPLNVKRNSISDSKEASPMPSRSPSPSPVSRNADQVVSSLSNAFKAVKRYYANNVSDADRQNAYDVFLGTFIPSKENGFLIWNMEKKKQAKVDQPDVGVGQKQDVDKEFSGMESTFKKVFSMKLGAPKENTEADMKQDHEEEDAEEEQEEQEEEVDEPEVIVLEKAPEHKDLVESTPVIPGIATPPSESLLDFSLVNDSQSPEIAASAKNQENAKEAKTNAVDPFWNLF